MSEKKFTPLADLPAPKTSVGGRPRTYRPEFCEIVLGDSEIARNGATDLSIAEALGVHTATVSRWKNDFPEFAAACEQAKQAADDQIEASFFQRAKGYEHEAVKIFMPAGAAAPVYAPYTERYAPDAGAAINWLKNRRPDKWRDRVEHTGAEGKDLIPAQTIDVLEIAKAIGTALRIAAERKPGDDAKLINGK